MERELKLVFPTGQTHSEPILVESAGGNAAPGGVWFIGAPQRHRISSAEPRPIL